MAVLHPGPVPVPLSAVAIFHLSMQKISRGAGRSAVAAAAYRSGEDLEDERTRERHDYTRRQGVEHSELVGWDGTRGELWNAAEDAEHRNDSVVARELVYALPAELSEDGRRRVAREIAREIRAMTGAAVDVNVHAPSRDPGADERNHHAHIQWTARAVDERGRFAAKKVDPFSLKEGPRLVREVRATAAVITNTELAREGHAVRVDPRSYAEQDAQMPPELQRLPTVHLGPLRTTLERSGVATVRGDLNRAAASHTAELSDPVERHRMLKEANAGLSHDRREAGAALHRLPEAPTAEGVAWQQRQFWAEFGRAYQKPEKARAQFERAPEGERLRTLVERPEAFGKLREVETHRTWGGLVSHYDTSGARSHAAQAAHDWRRWVLEPTAAVAAAAPQREALRGVIAEAEQWRSVLAVEVERLGRTPELVRARQREAAAERERAQIIEQARDDARRGGRDYAQERAHLRIAQLAKQEPAGPLLEPQREVRRGVFEELQREVTRAIGRERDRGLGR